MYPRAVIGVRDRLGEVHARIEFAVSVFANVILFLMAWGIAIDAILRYFFGSPFDFSVLTITEMYLLPAFVFGTAAYLQTQNGNIRVDIFRQTFPARVKHLINIVARSGALVVFSAMAYLAYRSGMDEMGNAVTGIVPYPTSYTWFLIAGGLFMLCLRLARQLIVDVEAVVGHREPGESDPGDPRERDR